jgi:bifunctional enzyme CysN/CysC
VSLLGIRHVIVAINKMDLVAYRESVFQQIREDYLRFASRLEIPDIRFIPLSALKGDNVVNRSESMGWYREPPLMELLDTIEVAEDRNFEDLRFPVQWVNRPNLDFRGYSGTLAAGVLRVGDEIVALPSGKTSRVKGIVTQDGELAEAFPPQAITVTLADEIDISRGDLLVHAGNEPLLDSRFNANVVWMNETPLTPGKPYYIKQNARTVSGSVSQIHHRTDVNTLEKHPAAQLRLNEIGLCEIALNGSVAFDAYGRCKATGAFIVIDRLSNVTVGAGMIVGPALRDGKIRRVSPEERAARHGQKALSLWMVGDDVRDEALALERRLFDRGFACTLLDEELLAADARVVARSLREAGLICLCVVKGEACPEEDAVNRILHAGQIDLDEIIRWISEVPPGGQPADFEI